MSLTNQEEVSPVKISKENHVKLEVKPYCCLICGKRAPMCQLQGNVWVYIKVKKNSSQRKP